MSRSFYNLATGKLVFARNAPRYRVRHWITWADGTRSEIHQDGRRDWRWRCGPGVEGVADTLRDAIADARDNGGTYTKERS